MTSACTAASAIDRPGAVRTFVGTQCTPSVESTGENLSLSDHVCTICGSLCALQGNGTADGYGNFVGTGSLDSSDGYFQGSGTFAGIGDCEGSQVTSS